MSVITPIYHGDCSISEVPGSNYQQKRGQADCLIRRYSGDASLAQDFIYNNPIIGQNNGNSPVFDYQFPWMVLQDLDLKYDGPVADFTLTFYGVNALYGVQATNLLTTGSWRTLSATLETNNPRDGSWSVYYYAPDIEYRYVTNQINDTPIYQGLSRNPETITLMNPRQLAGPNGTGPVPGYTRQGKFLYQPFSVCTSFRYTQRGTCYDYSEVWAVIINKPSDTLQGAFTIPMPTSGTAQVPLPDAGS